VVGDEHVVFFPGIEPPRREARKMHLAAELDELADGVGYLELAAGRGLDLGDGSKIEGRNI